MLITVLSTACMAITTSLPLQVHPENPHYFLFRGKPAVLITSGEHYGAVLNLDFDFLPYLNELQAHGLNLTRTFSGTYREVPGSFKIERNTLAPRPGRYCAPWPLTADKFDLDRWDPAYFGRLKRFVKEASRRGIVVEYVLFCPFYDEALWAVNPMNARNNVNGVGDCPLNEVFTLKHPALLDRQLAFVRNAVTELNAFDNVYFEICNEPYFGGVTLEWQRRVSDTIVQTENGLPNKHLIAQNIANGKARVENPDPNVAIFNFHYASPPDTVAMNWDLNKPIGFDETGFKGTGDELYRRQAWEFLLAGGAVFSNLDYSFTPDTEDGTAEVKDPTPGGGGPRYREQLAILKRFMNSLDFVRMRPEPRLVTGGPQEGVSAFSLAEPGKQYAIYVRAVAGAKLRLELPAGRFEASWTDPIANKSVRSSVIDHPGGSLSLPVPQGWQEIALRIVSRPGSH